MASVPSDEPAEIWAGDGLAWTKSFSSYLPSEGWMLSYILRTHEQIIRIDEEEVGVFGEVYDIAVAASTTATWISGRYSWVAQLRRTVGNVLEVKTVASGFLQVHPNYATDAVIDPRTHNEICLDNIMATIEKRASDGVLRYTIGSRELQSYTLAELLSLKNHYANLVIREKGGGGTQFYGARFSRAG